MKILSSYKWFLRNGDILLNFLKTERISRDILVLHMCTINLDHMMYSPSDMEPNRHIFVILSHFLLFYSPHPNNLKILKK